MIRTAVVAAAGRGTRMKDLSKEQPKHLIEVAGRPFFHFVLDRLVEAGFERIIVIVGYKAEKMEGFLADYPAEIEVVNQQQVVGDKYGTAAAVESVKRAVGKEPFVYVNGDNVYPLDVLRAIMKDDGYHHIVCMHHEEPQRYGVLEVDEDGLLEHIIEKPEEPPSTLINLGMYAFQPEVFGVIRGLKPSPRGEYEITDAIEMLALEQRVKVTEVPHGTWMDFGRPEDIPAVEEYFKNVAAKSAA